MTGLTTRELRHELAEYTRKSYALGLAVLFRDFALFVGGVYFALHFQNYLLKTLFAVVAGMAIGSLFVVAHDAAHNSLTPSKRLNAFVGRLAFLPALHNYTLWLIVHNRMHHVHTCVQGQNSWSPLTKQEFDGLPFWRRGLERLYRAPVLGFAPYYAKERWLKEKFFPPCHFSETRRVDQYLDFLLIVACLAAWFALLYLASLRIAGLAFWEAVVWGFVIPQYVWNTLGGFTVYAHHTHPQVPWFRTTEEMEAAAGQAGASVHMLFPVWYGVVSNNIMDHPAHHVSTKIPLYNLRRAQRRLNEVLGEAAIVERFSPVRFFGTMVRCKLYDYDNHRWLSFAGVPTTEASLVRSRPPALSGDAALA